MKSKKRGWVKPIAIVLVAAAICGFPLYSFISVFNAREAQREAAGLEFQAFKHLGHVRIIESGGFSLLDFVANDEFVPARSRACNFANLRDGTFTWSEVQDGYWKVDYAITSEIADRTNMGCPTKGTYYTQKIDRWLTRFLEKKKEGEHRAALIGRVAEK